MLYEFLLVTKECRSDGPNVHYRCAVPESRFDFVKKVYTDALSLFKDFFRSYVLINLLDDSGNFVEVIQ